jgi:ferritin-like metal-binding protein YciE
MKDLFAHELQDLYSAERQIIDALPDVIEAVSSTRLRHTLEEHLEVTRGQLERLERIFDMIDRKPSRSKCEGMEGILDEGEEVIDIKAEDEALKDAALIGAAQRVEHYEMAGYGTARNMARLLGLEEAAQLLQQALDEEKAADRDLTEIADSEVNVQASRKVEEEEGGGWLE